MSVKVLVRRTDYDGVREFVAEAFEMFRVERKLDNPVYLKPNFLKFTDPATGCITHPSVIRAVVELLKELGYDVVVAEGGFRGDAASKCFAAFGLREIARCVDLNQDRFVRVNIGGRSLEKADVAQTAVEARRSFISLPKMKVHHLTKVTIGIKNNMGFLKKPAVGMHIGIHGKLVDLLRYFTPRFTIVDGVIGGEASESWTKPVAHGVMLASDNVVACDAVAAELMGFEAGEIKHIALAAIELDLDLNGLKTVGDSCEHLRRKYRLSLFSKMRGAMGI